MVDRAMSNVTVPSGPSVNVPCGVPVELWLVVPDPMVPTS